MYCQFQFYLNGIYLYHEHSLALAARAAYGWRFIEATHSRMHWSPEAMQDMKDVLFIHDLNFPKFCNTYVYIVVAINTTGG